MIPQKTIAIRWKNADGEDCLELFVPVKSKHEVWTEVHKCENTLKEAQKFIELIITSGSTVEVVLETY